MYKKLAAIAIVVLLMSGCSATELRYMALMLEVEKLQAMQVQGSIIVELDQEFIERTPTLKQDIDGELFETLAVFANNPEIQYSGEIKVVNDAMEVDLQFYFNENGTNWDLFNVVIEDDALYIDTVGLKNLNDLIKSLSPGDVNSFNTDIVDEAIAGGFEYILIGDLQLPSHSATIDEYKAVTNLITDIFRNFDTGLVQQVNGDTYRLQVNLPNIFDVFARGVEYLYDNSQHVYDTIQNNDWINENFLWVEDYETFVWDLEMLRDTALWYHEDLQAELSDPNSMLSSYKDSHYFSSITKGDSDYRLETGIVGVYSGTEFFAIKSNMYIIPMDITAASIPDTNLPSRFGEVFEVEVFEVEVFEFDISELELLNFTRI